MENKTKLREVELQDLRDYVSDGTQELKVLDEPVGVLRK